MKKVVAMLLSTVLCIGSVDLQGIQAEALIAEKVTEQSVSENGEGETVSANDDTITVSVNDETVIVSGQEETHEEEEKQGWDGVTTQSVYETEEYKILFELTGVWEGGFNATVKIENTSDEAIQNWYLLMPLQNAISGIWNAEITDNTEEGYLIKNAGWNQDIPVGGSVEFGLSGSENFIDFPQTYEMQTSKAEASTEGYEIEYVLDSDWGTGFSGRILITNNGNEIIEDWVLEFDFARKIGTIWNATIQSEAEEHYVIENADYNANIGIGETISIGFNGQNGSAEDVPENYQLYSYVPMSDELANLNMDEDYLMVNAAYSQVEIGYQDTDTADSVTKNLELIQDVNGVVVTWHSSNETLVKPSGEVIRPENQSETVTLTATITSNDYSEQKEFEIYVIKNTYADYDTDSIEDIESLELLYRYNGGDPDNLKVYLKEDETIKFISGSFSDMIVESPEEAVLSLYGIKTLMGSKSPEEELEWASTNKDKYGTSFRFSQVYKSIPIYGTSIVVSTDAEGYTAALQSSFVKDIDISTIPALSREEAMIKLQELGLTAGEVDKLYVYMDEDIPKLAWNIYADDGVELYNCLVDANNGEVLLQNSCVAYEYASGSNMVTWKDELGKEQTFPVTYYNQDGKLTFILKDERRNISIYDMMNSTIVDISYGVLKQRKNNEWADREVSAYVNTAKAYDYYLTHFGRKGFDNGSSEIKVGVFLNKRSSYHSKGSLFFGDGGSYIYSGAASLDTVGHEYTHGVVACTTTLTSYRKDAPGAINEGYADIFGYFIEGKDDAEWLHREGNTKGARALRNMSNPAEFNQPSKIGDFYYQDFTIDSDDNGGVHKNNTIVSHACYLMWKNGISDKDRLADLWYHSLLLGYDKNSTFKSVRMNVSMAAIIMGMSLHEMEIINSAFDAVGVGMYPGVDINGTNIITGKVVKADLDTTLGNNLPLAETNVTLIRNADGEKTSALDCLLVNTTTQSDGIFSISDIVPGTYRLTVSKEGYYDTSQIITVSETKLNNYCSTVELIPLTYVGTGSASGTIKDSTTGAGVGGLTLRVRTGINTKDGEVILTTTTKQNGVYELMELSTGHYCIEIGDNRILETGKNAYFKTYFNVKILGGHMIGNQNATVSNVIGINQLRIVLEWGANPRDLDSHLIGPTDNGGEFHVYYGSRRYAEGTTIMSDLDIDDRWSYGPETTTIYKKTEGVYTFYVHHFAGSGTLATSGACVKVYAGDSNEPIYVFNVPTNQTGRIWTVFRYNSKTNRIEPINCVDNVVR